MSINKKLIIFLLAAVFMGTGILFSVRSAKQDASISENKAVFEAVEPLLSNYKNYRER
ncbi:hypothetical protein L6279_00275 [Candidatus Parcubacteria bacterium]|nr:hypothetical protein [Candidatus Parcubacteria bacterium]